MSRNRCEGGRWRASLGVALSKDLWSCEPIQLSIPRKLPHAESNLNSIANHLGTAASTEEKRTHECSKAVAEFLDVLCCDDCSGFLQQCVRSNELQSC